MKVTMLTTVPGGPAYGSLASGTPYELPYDYAKSLVDAGSAKYTNAVVPYSNPPDTVGPTAAAAVAAAGVSLLNGGYNFRGDRTIMLGDSTAEQHISGYLGKASTNIVVSGGQATMQCASAIGSAPGNWVQVIPPAGLRVAGSFATKIESMSANDTITFNIPAWAGIAEQTSDASVWKILTLHQANDGGWATWFAVYSKIPLIYVANYAVGGVVTSELAQQLSAALNGPKFDNFIIEMGYNDINNAGSAAAAFAAVPGAAANILSAVDKLLSLGKQGIVAMPSGLTTAITNYAYKNAAFDELRKRLIAAQRSRPGLLIADLRDDLINASGNLNALASPDGLHKAGFGGQYPGKITAVRLAARTPMQKGIRNSAQDDAVTNAWIAAGSQYPNVLKNGTFGGTQAQAGASPISPDGAASMPTSWSAAVLSGGGTVSTRASNGASGPTPAVGEIGNIAGRGNCARVDYTTPATGSFQIKNDTAIALQAGSWHQLRFRLLHLADAVNLFAISLQLYMPSFIAGSMYPLYVRPGGGALHMKASDSAIEFVSQPFFIGSNPGTVTWFTYFQFTGAGSCSVEMSCAGVDVIDNPFA